MRRMPIFIRCPATLLRVGLIRSRLSSHGPCRTHVHVEVRSVTMRMYYDINILKPETSSQHFVKRLYRRTESGKHQVLWKQYNGQVLEDAAHLHVQFEWSDILPSQSHFSMTVSLLLEILGVGVSSTS